MADAPYQSLYRRYRPQRFADILGQDHITQALRNAVREERVAHGYLFSGPRGTGKTTSARVLAKALNCAKLDDGEPCGLCESCQAIASGASYDVIELDAASNRGIDRMRALLEGVALGTGGRRKIYIVDEVHMLTPEASAALLKTLEEPPSHVVFVLATTDPQKVLPTIRSRVQNYEFRLMTAETLAGLVRTISDDAGIELDAGGVDAVVRRGAGSARDALSYLDQVAALGTVDERSPSAAQVLGAICDRDPAGALAAVAEATASGRDPRRLAEEILDLLRSAFLSVMAPHVMSVPPDDAEWLTQAGNRMGPALAVRAMEAVGDALAGMRDALDPRVLLDVALVRVTRPDVDPSPAALLERITRLEQALAGQVSDAPPPPRPVGQSTPQRSESRSPDEPRASGPAAARGALGAHRRAERTAKPAPKPAPPVTDPPPTEARPAASDARPAASGGAFPTRDQLTKAWGDAVLAELPQRPRARFKVGRFVSADDGVAVFSLPNAIHRDRCDEVRPEVEEALTKHFGTRVRLRLVVDDGGSGGAAPDPAPPAASEAVDDDVRPDELIDAPPLASAEERIKEAFPGAEEVDG